MSISIIVTDVAYVTPNSFLEKGWQRGTKIKVTIMMVQNDALFMLCTGVHEMIQMVSADDGDLVVGQNLPKQHHT